MPLPAIDRDAISVIISTYERPDACERALRSVLEQTHEPLEILICDDGSTDETAKRFRGWEQHCEKVRYLRTPHNTGTPASTRNLGIAQARADWIAFLDDDDQWLPDKLMRQGAAIALDTADVIATNALRSDGSTYFPDVPPTLRPTPSELLRANPVITSSVVVKRSLVSFPVALWMRGIEDYAAWLDMADRGARFLVLGEPLVSYQDASSDRLSAARARTEIAVARLAWRRLIRQPTKRANIGTVIRRTAGALYVVGSDTVGVVRAGLSRTT
jgi:glycosyltransferase involved in cell wall biosynthesis